MKNIILDYEQVEERLKEIADRETVIQEDNLGTTTFGLQIHHYIIGNGNKEVVITGATHGCEIISTDFVIHLMEQLSNDANPNGIDLNEYKFHFIPMLNPEGYLISTSAIRQLIPRDILVELYGMGGNPIGPYGDLEGNYKNLIDSNLDAFLFALRYADISEKISQASYNMFEERMSEEVSDDIVGDVYRIMRTASNMVMSWLDRFGTQTRMQVIGSSIQRKEFQEEER